MTKVRDRHIESKFQEDYTSLDILEYIFGEYIPYDREDLLYWISWIISWLREEFKSNNLQFTRDGIENLDPKLRSWIQYITIQLTFKEINQ